MPGFLAKSGKRLVSDATSRSAASVPSLLAMKAQIPSRIGDSTAGYAEFHPRLVCSRLATSLKPALMNISRELLDRVLVILHVLASVDFRFGGFDAFSNLVHFKSLLL